MKNKLDCLKLINFIEKSIDFKNFILPCQNILVAYSGGQDSSALLAIFFILSKKWHFNIGVVYCNHNWTRSTTQCNTAFEIVQSLNLPFYFVDSARAIKPENQARKWRYQAFATLLNNSQYDLVLTGHTLSDCAETIIFNLCRGSGLKGVCSLKKFQTFPQEPRPRFQFKIQLFSYNDFKTYSNQTKPIFRNCLNNNFLQIKQVSTPHTKIENWMFACYLKKQNTINLTQAKNVTNFGINLKETLAIKTQFTDSSKKCLKNKSDKCEQFYITFFDPMIYLFVNSRFKQTKFLYLFPCKICSLFPTLKFYLFSNLKTGINWPFFNKTFQSVELKSFKSNQFGFGFGLKRFLWIPYVRMHGSNTVIFFISSGIKSQLKNKKNQIQFSALLDRKLKQKKSLSPFFYYFQPTKTSFLATKVLYNNFLNHNKLDISNKLNYLRCYNFEIVKSSDYLSINNQCKLKSKLIIYRPLIGINRKVISLFDQQLELKLINDQSNNDVNLTRNFIRQKILPLLKQINPQVEQNLYKFSQIAAFYLEKNGDINFDSDKLNIFKP